MQALFKVHHASKARKLALTGHKRAARAQGASKGSQLSPPKGTTRAKLARAQGASKGFQLVWKTEVSHKPLRRKEAEIEPQQRKVKSLSFGQ
jgi:hypothetical protein